MATTYQAIATVEVGAGGASSIAFSSIPTDGTYTDLVLFTSLRCARSNWYSQARAYFNSSTTSYSWRALLYDYPSTPSSSNGTDVAYWYPPAATATTNTFGNIFIYIPNYAGSNNKSYSIDAVPENNSANNYLGGLWAGLWSNTAAITSITIDSPISDTFVQYSTATLYGIKNS